MAAVLSVWCLLALAGCQNDTSEDDMVDPPDSCSLAAQRQFVLEVMQDIYFWNDRLPAVQAADFVTPQALLAALRFQPLDRFSAIVDQEPFETLLDNGQTVALGLDTRLVAPDALRISQVFVGSTAAQAGLQRGDRILAIDGRDLATILAAEGLPAAFGPRQVGLAVRLRLAARDGMISEVTLTKTVVTIDPTPVVDVFDIAGRPTGYVLFRTFSDPAVPALRQAFALFRQRGVQDVVLDVRYNGGGRTAVAAVLGNLLGGRVATDEVLFRMVYNANNRFRDSTVRLALEPQSLDLQRLVVITSDATASASELVISALAPYVQVATIGSTTLGKPVGQTPIAFCERLLLPVTFQTRNANNEGDYFAGIPAACPAADDVETALGDPAEASLATALGYLATGTCPVAATEPATRQRARSGPETEAADRVPDMMRIY
jgi:C-terminal processing protease CtpA/Prc